MLDTTRLIPRYSSLGVSALVVLTLGVGCAGNGDGGSTATGGRRTGGTNGSGGNAAGGSASGGAPSAGGSSGTGGVTASGGVTATGGSQGTGAADASTSTDAGQDLGSPVVDGGPVVCPSPPSAPIPATVTWANVNAQKPEWYATPEAIQVAENILYYQTATGAWSTQLDMTDRTAYRMREDFGFQKQLLYLTKMIAATGCDRYKASFAKGIDRLMAVQLPNGAWMEMSPYGVNYDFIVRFIDEGMTGYINLLYDIVRNPTKYPFFDTAKIGQCKAAVDKGVDYLLRTQVVSRGQLAGWPSHPHKTTYQAWVRSPYELPGISGADGVDVFKFLMLLDKPSSAVISAIHTAAAWYDANKILGKRVVDVTGDAGTIVDRVLTDDATAPPIWARYYDIETGKPFFAGRDGIKRWTLAEVPLERRIGFSWYGNAPAAALLTYEKWKTTTGAGTSAPDGGVIASDGGVLVTDGGAATGGVSGKCGPTPVTNVNFVVDPVGKPRVIASTDGERDDKSSMVRFLLYATDYDVQGIIEVNSRYQKTGHSSEKWIQAHLDAYKQVLPMLRVHNPAYPDAEKLTAALKLGDENILDILRAPDDFATKDTAGSQMIIDALLDNDPRPVHLPAWGGGNTIAYALYKIKTTYPPAQFQKAVAKARMYFIYYQDAGGYWIEDNIPGVYLYESYAWDSVWNYQSIFGPSPANVKAYMNGDWLTNNVTTGHGPLGARYSLEQNAQTYISEGDTPSFLPLINNGLEQYSDFALGGWGGRPVRDWGLHMSDGYDECDRNLTYWRWIPAAQNDFQARLNWGVSPTFAGANHNPVASVTDKRRTAKVGSIVTMDASASKDPDGNTLGYKWWRYDEADSATSKITISNSTTKLANFVAPNEPGKQIHVILEVTDNGTPPLTNYQRVIVDLQ